MTTEATAKKDTQKLQRAIVDGLEQVKALDLKVFNTEHLSALFERVIIASGTSNRQTKALASSVRDAVRDAGFPKPRMEGEANGEWIIVDCGRAVVHVMQPTIRSYYNLEEIWGGTPVRLKFGAPKPVATRSAATKSESKVAPAHARSEKSAAKKVVSGKAPLSLRRSSAVKTAARAAKAAAGTPVKAAPKTAVRARAKPAVRKAPVRKA